MPGDSPAFSQFTINSAVDLLMQAFQGVEEATPEEVDRQVADLLRIPLFGHLRSSSRRIVEEVLRRTRVVIGGATILNGEDESHVPWLPQVDRANWRFWPRFDDYLRRKEQFSPSVLRELDQSTDQTLAHLEDPDRAGKWDRRGLVVGHIQSGKTTHYTALAAKALDAGYQIVIILAGVHNSLRSQTHERIDRHLIGRHSAALVDAVRQGGGQDWTTGIVGVGEEDRLLGRPALACTLLTCTTSAEDGDFRVGVANQVGFQVGPGSRLVLVIKKNATILRNLIRWLRVQNATGSSQNDSLTMTNPVLVIDDEADHASINTRTDPDEDPTTINQLIRQLLISFDRVAFVGYTATPFANIFAADGDPAGRYGPDLFPSAFIVNLKAPSDYVGPGLVFGHPGDESAGIAEQLPLPMYVAVTDSVAWIPDGHRRDWTPGQLPDSLVEALRLFLIVSAARAARGQDGVHSSMLIHATRFIDVQARIERQVSDAINGLRDVVGLGARIDLARIEAEFKFIWENRVVLSHPAFAQALGDRCLALPDWKATWIELKNVLDRVQVMRINGQSTDALAYSRTPAGLCVIAIGGDKLSRGLTLEGLSVSYFLRTSNMFDTLMQMGRWFGYRPGYADLCRVYTTPTLHKAFQEIALAMDDLRADLDYMALVGKTPREFGLRVRAPSDGMLITSGNKIRNGEDVAVRFAGTLVQALEIAAKGAQADRNRSAVRQLIVNLGDSSQVIRGESVPHSIWRTIPVTTVIDFLAEYEAFSTPSFFNHCEALRRYIADQAAKNELTHWTIALIGKQKPIMTVQIEGRMFPLVYRKPKDGGASDKFETQVVVGSLEEAADLNAQEFAVVVDKSRDPKKKPSKDGRIPLKREAIREVRPQERGLLLLYLIEPKAGTGDDFIPSVAISFPESKTAEPLTYTVNPTWREQRGLLASATDELATA